MKRFFLNRSSADRSFFILLHIRNAGDITDQALLLANENPSPENVKAIAVITGRGSSHTKGKVLFAFQPTQYSHESFPF
jgi:hypothetical protein